MPKYTPKFRRSVRITRKEYVRNKSKQNETKNTNFVRVRLRRGGDF